MADPDVHHLLLYTYVEDMSERRGPYREAHLDRIRAGRDAGVSPKLSGQMSLVGESEIGCDRRQTGIVIAC